MVLKRIKKWYILNVERKIIVFSLLILSLLTVFSVGVVKQRPDLHGELFLYFNPDDSFDETARTEIITDRELLKDSSGVYHNMRLEFPYSVNIEKIVFDNNLLSRRFDITVNGVGRDYPTVYPVAGDTKGIKSVEYKSNKRTGILEVAFNEVTECEYLKEGRFIYIDFYSPRDLYDRIIVLDAGHGGEDKGAIAGEVNEKDLNLAMVNKLNDILINETSADEGSDNSFNKKIGIYKTRFEDFYLSPEDRAEFVNSIGPDLLVSIHLNSTTSNRKDEIYGTEIMYYSKEESGRSKEIAKKLSKVISDAIEGKDRGILAGDNIYILRSVKAKAVLCEIGFISNPKELKKIMNEEYQDKIVRAISNVCVEEIQ